MDLARAFIRTLGVHSKWPALSVRYEGAPHGQEQVLRSGQCLSVPTGGGRPRL